MNLLDFIFPKFCISCGWIGSYICSTCSKDMKPILQSETICPECERGAIDGITHPGCRKRNSLDGLISFFHYKGPVQKAIKSIKYRFVSDISQTVLNTAFNRKNILELYSFLQTYTVIPIPLHTSRYNYRGFNQAELFSKGIAFHYKFQFRRDIIRRVKPSIPQVEMKNKQQRIVNMKDMFVVNQNNVVPKEIIIVDDVFTTGATMREAGRVLKKAGVQSVWAITIAR